jgi:GNAT superfamily N-acetyltransferase
VLATSNCVLDSADLATSSMPVVLRYATAADAELLAEHRVAMFREMGSILPEFEEPLRHASTAYFASAIPVGEYVGWIASPTDGSPPVAGAGVQFRSLLPRPTVPGDGLLLGREGLILNLYTVPNWRRQGIAKHLMETIVAWAGEVGIVRLVLAASPAGRPLYEKIGFVATREMSYTGRLAPGGPWTGAM